MGKKKRSVGIRSNTDGCGGGSSKQNATQDKVIVVKGKKFNGLVKKLEHSLYFQKLFANDKETDEFVVNDVNADDFSLFVKCLDAKICVNKENFIKLMMLSELFESAKIRDKCLEYLKKLKNLRGFNLIDLADLNLYIENEKLHVMIESELIVLFEREKSWSEAEDNIEFAINYNFRDLRYRCELLIIDEYKQKQYCSKHNTEFILGLAHKYGLEQLKEFDGTKGKTNELYDKYLNLIHSYCMPVLKDYLERFFIVLLKKDAFERRVQFTAKAKEYQLDQVLEYIEMSLCKSFIDKDKDGRRCVLDSYLTRACKYSFDILKETIESFVMQEFAETGNMSYLILAFEYNLDILKNEVAFKYSACSPSGQFAQENKEHIQNFPADINEFLLTAVMDRLSFNVSE